MESLCVVIGFGLLAVLVHVLIIRWVFRIDEIVGLLGNIRDELRKQNAEWPQLQKPQPAEDSPPPHC